MKQTTGIKEAMERLRKCGRVYDGPDHKLKYV